ncbi:MAG TPA: DUF4062 domain-containing protein [Allosphingosinicella sp.]|jgi:hypothetical protein
MTIASQLRVFVSSSVYGRESLLEQIGAILTGFGYEVWSSHLGTLPIVLNAGTYESCLRAAERCDIFFGLITPRYGSGNDGAGGPSITHREFDRAIELDKPRVVLAHEQVVLARRLVSDLGFGGKSGRARLKLTGRGVIDDLRLIDMYEAATQEDKPILERDNNWVQKYQTDGEVLGFVGKQFGRYAEMEEFVQRWREREEAAQ